MPLSLCHLTGLKAQWSLEYLHYLQWTLIYQICTAEHWNSFSLQSSQCLSPIHWYTECYCSSMGLPTEILNLLFNGLGHCSKARGVTGSDCKSSVLENLPLCVHESHPMLELIAMVWELLLAAWVTSECKTYSAVVIIWLFRCSLTALFLNERQYKKQLVALLLLKLPWNSINFFSLLLSPAYFLILASHNKSFCFQSFQVRLNL